MAQAQQAAEFNRELNKKPGKPRFAHTCNTPFGMGESYGTGVKAKVAKMRTGYGFQEASSKQLGTPPKKLA